MNEGQAEPVWEELLVSSKKPLVGALDEQGHAILPRSRVYHVVSQARQTPDGPEFMWVRALELLERVFGEGTSQSEHKWEGGFDRGEQR